MVPKTHIDALKQTPFWIFFKMIINRVVTIDNSNRILAHIDNIIATSEKNEDVSDLGGKMLKLVVQHVSLLLGLSEYEHMSNYERGFLFGRKTFQ